jgi:hypothetical protein
MNATELPQRYRVQVGGLPGIRIDGAADIEVAAAEARWVTLSARVAPDVAATAGPGAHPIEFRIERIEAAGQGRSNSEKSTFVVPR